jgi:hypothetical protein
MDGWTPWFTAEENTIALQEPLHGTGIKVEVFGKICHGIIF